MDSQTLAILLVGALSVVNLVMLSSLKRDRIKYSDFSLITKAVLTNQECVVSLDKRISDVEASK